jgi:hypothetical protein
MPMTFTATLFPVAKKAEKTLPYCTILLVLTTVLSLCIGTRSLRDIIGGYDLRTSKTVKGQGGNGKWIAPPDKIVLRREDRVYVTTLEELIEACGGGFEFLGLKDDRKTWACYSQEETPRAFEGVNALEAVANLWLALINVQ